MIWGAPACLSRTTTMSILYELSVATVSMRLSPFTVAVEEPPKFRLSAERRFSANSKELRVRVDGSLNILTIVLPFSVGTFLIAR